jgi:hypothetical protein
VPLPTPTYLTIDSSVHIHMDGNSIWASQAGLPTMDQLAPWTSFVAATGCTLTNSSIAGQTWADMAANITDVNASWNAAKTNVLICGETRNTLANGTTTFATCKANALTYIANVKAAHPGWIIVLMGSLPSDGVPTATFNATMIDVDEYMRNNLAEFSAAKFIRYRDLSFYAGDGLSRQGFMSTIANCIEGTPPYVHPRGTAREQIATRMVRDVQLIPV